MSSILDKLRSEPVRTILYPLVVILFGVLVTRGIIDSSTAGILAAVVAALLGVTATETARAKVVPLAKLPDIPLAP